MKRNNRITFAQLEGVLYELGFVRKVVPDVGVGYRHSPTGTVVIVRLHKPGDTVPDYVTAATRLQLDEQGIIEAEDFDAMLQVAAA